MTDRKCPHCDREIPEGEEAGVVTVKADGVDVERVLCDEALYELAEAMLASGRAVVTLDDNEEEG